MIYCLLYYSTHDLNWEIKLKPEEWGQVCVKGEAEKMGVKGTRKCSGWEGSLLTANLIYEGCKDLLLLLKC